VFWRIPSDVFVRTLATKMLNFSPEVAIWWTLKLYFWELANTLSKS